jgi:hypothetical protein
MTTTKAVLIVGFSILFLLLGFGSLLTYSAYEKGQAQFLALQAKRKEAIDLLQQESDEDERRIKCDLVWHRGSDQRHALAPRNRVALRTQCYTTRDLIKAEIDAIQATLLEQLEKQMPNK